MRRTGILALLVLSVGGGADIQRPPNTALMYNEAGTGTTVNKLVKLTGAPSTAIIAAAGDTGGVVGICASGCGVAGASATASVIQWGNASCAFDGATTAGHYVGISAGTAGSCTDTGAGYPAASQVIGRVLSTNGGAGTYAMNLFPAEIKAPVAGAVVTSLTAAAFDALGGPFANGEIYLLSDSPYTIFRVAAAWVYRFGSQTVVRPPTAGWTLTNAGGGAVDTTNVRIVLSGSVGASSNYHVVSRAHGGVPYVHYMLIQGWTTYTIGAGWRASATGRLIAGQVSAGGGLSVNYMTDPTTFSSQPVSLAIAGNGYANGYWIRLEDNNVNLILSVGTSRQTLQQVYSAARGAFLADPNEVMFFVSTNDAAVPSSVELLSYE